MAAATDVRDGEHHLGAAGEGPEDREIAGWEIPIEIPIEIDPENHQFLEETSLPTPIWQGLC